MPQQEGIIFVLRAQLRRVDGWKTTFAYKLVVERKKIGFWQSFDFIWDAIISTWSCIQICKSRNWIFFSVHSQSIWNIHISSRTCVKNGETGTAFIFCRCDGNAAVKHSEKEEKIQKYCIIKWMGMLIALNRIGKFDECLYLSECFFLSLSLFLFNGVRQTI